jgi:hypothetical protein
MSFWAATVPANGKQLTIGENKCDIIITQASLRSSESLPSGSVVTLLAMTKVEGSKWVPLARFRTGDLECTPFRIAISAGSETNLKVQIFKHWRKALLFLFQSCHFAHTFVNSVTSFTMPPFPRNHPFAITGRRNGRRGRRGLPGDPG